jgi:hypothetical protein
MMLTDKGDDRRDSWGGSFGFKSVFGRSFDRVFPAVDALDGEDLHTGYETGDDQSTGKIPGLSCVGQCGDDDLTLYFTLHSVL